MSAWNALLWGALASSSLFIGHFLAGPLAGNRKAVGLLMGFGAGTLVSAVGYQLVPEASFENGIGVGISFALGAPVRGIRGVSGAQHGRPFAPDCRKSSAVHSHTFPAMS
jgi:hypothetical protein